MSRDLPLDFHPFAQKAAEAVRCAAEQNKYWELRDTMISNSTHLGQDAILKYLSEILQKLRMVQLALQKTSG